MTSFHRRRIRNGRRGVESEVIVKPGAGHDPELVKESMPKAIEWFDNFLPPARSKVERCQACLHPQPGGASIMKKCALVLFFSLATLCAPPSATLRGQDKNAVKVDVAGTWNVETEIGAITFEMIFTLKQEGVTITGKYDEQDVSGRLDDHQIKLELTHHDGKVFYTGTAARDVMKGTLKYGDLSGTWTARRADAKAQSENRRSGRSISRPQPVYPEAAPICAPEDLRKVSLPNTTIDEVTIDPNLNVCRVTATVTHPPANDKVTIWIALPLADWNGRFFGAGGGGFSGGSPVGLAVPARAGFAAGSTDGGHPGGSPKFALTLEGRLDWQNIRDFAYLGIHDMTVVGKALVQAFYGKSARYAYFFGGSGGGRQALAEAQWFPEDYDGIYSICPAVYWERFLICDLWPQVVMLEAQNWVSKDKLRAVNAALIEACDADDGVRDGSIDDPLSCTWDPKVFVGKSVGDSVFTETDAECVRKMWQGPRGHGGKFLWYGFPRGTDLVIPANTRGEPLFGEPFPMTYDWIKYFLLQDPEWDWKTLTAGQFELLFNQSVEQYGAIIGTAKPDLSGLRDRKGKLLIVQGYSDQLIPTEGILEYYERVLKQMGGLEQVQPFARLFMVPDADHGVGEYVEDMLDSLVEWVEKGRAPERVISTRKIPGGKIVKRPVYPYPLRAVYQGAGDSDDEANWVSKEGPRFRLN
ncbi:MAG: tannase/feruloyl esterase family alpha/beta hydrolase [Planctomycetaceae bacterium]